MSLSTLLYAMVFYLNNRGWENLDCKRTKMLHCMLCGTSGTELQTILDLSKSVRSFSSADGAVKNKSVNDTVGKVGCSDEWCELFVEAGGRSCCHATTHGRKLGMSNEARFRFPSRAPAIIFKSLTVKAKSIFLENIRYKGCH